MKYKLLSVYSGTNTDESSKTNIGDYVQALASLQFLPQLDGFVDRETLNTYNGEPCKVIMNGWFMHDCNNWPPSSSINPIFISFHLNVTAYKILEKKENIEYFQKYAPIGCRDTETVAILKRYGIDAFFSGCITLTLGNTYKNLSKDSIDYVVDPFIPVSRNPLFLAKTVIFTLCNYSSVCKVARKIKRDGYSFIRKILVSAIFLRLYSEVVSRELLVNAEYITQESVEYRKISDDYQRLKQAEELVKMYSSARLVITSRIHCALPCLGLDTPVLFTADSMSSKISNCRYGGLIALFNVLECSKERVKLAFQFNGKISEDNLPVNKDDWKKCKITIMDYLAKAL